MRMCRRFSIGCFLATGFLSPCFGQVRMDTPEERFFWGVVVDSWRKISREISRFEGEYRSWRSRTPSEAARTLDLALPAADVRFYCVGEWQKFECDAKDGKLWVACGTNGRQQYLLTRQVSGGPDAALVLSDLARHGAIGSSLVTLDQWMRPVFSSVRIGWGNPIDTTEEQTGVRILAMEPLKGNRKRFRLNWPSGTISEPGPEFPAEVVVNGDRAWTIDSWKCEIGEMTATGRNRYATRAKIPVPSFVEWTQSINGELVERRAFEIRLLLPCKMTEDDFTPNAYGIDVPPEPSDPANPGQSGLRAWRIGLLAAGLFLLGIVAWKRSRQKA